MNNKITIIEGPTPDFEFLSENTYSPSGLNWISGIMEGPYLYDTALTRLRTLNAQSLLDRCQDTWSQNQTMYLEYKDRIGLRIESPIIAAQAVTVEEGDLLLLWVRSEFTDALDEADDDGLDDSDFDFDDSDDFEDQDSLDDEDDDHGEDFESFDD